MTRLTQSLQVAFLVGATKLERNNVVNLLGRSNAPALLAVFTQRAGGDVGVAYFAPVVVVALVDLRVPLVGAVALVFGLSVGCAKPSVG